MVKFPTTNGYLIETVELATINESRKEGRIFLGGFLFFPSPLDKDV